jgi:phosphoglycerate dehydrogenase-like enzyme
LLSTSDVVTVHSNLTAKIEHLISKAQFGMMKPTAILLNAARPHCRRGRAFLRTRP